MTENADWTELLRAEEAYGAARKRLFDGDPVPVLRLALSQRNPTPPDRDSALRVLREYGATRLDVVAGLAPELFEFALDMSWRGDRVRQTLCLLDSAVLQAALADPVAAFLADDTREAADYGGLLTLVDQAKLPNLRQRVLDAAAASADPDVRSLAR